MKILFILWLCSLCFVSYQVGEYDRPLRIDYERELTDKCIIDYLEYARGSHQYFVDHPKFDRWYTVEQQRCWVKVYDVVLEKIR